jgi:hypothetical protein
MKFSYDRAWTDVVMLWRAHGELLAILAGLFLMVPDFARNLFLPLPAIVAFDEATLALLEKYFLDNSLWLFLLNLPVLLGSAAMLALLLDARRPTVGEALALAFVMLPSIFVLNLLMQFAIFGGLLVFLVPGIYLIGRLSVASGWQMANRSMNPITAVARSFDLTRGNGWAIAGIILIFAITGAVIARGIGAILGILIAFVIPKMSLAAVAAFLSAILSATIVLVMLLLAAAIYRQLAPQAS